MKRYLHTTLLSSLVIGLSLTWFPGPAEAADTCSRGLGEPPFLSFGVDSNLLMMIDNSGSMLDMAYIDPDTDGFVDNNGDGIDDTADRSTQCFDESFLFDPATLAIDPNIEYAGNFDLVDEATGLTNWYVWTNANVVPWETGTVYNPNTLVTYEGVTYRAWTGGTSAGADINGDNTATSPDWLPVLRPEWRNATWYHEGSFVFTPTKQVFRAAADGTSNGTGPTADSGVPWVEVLKWQNNTAYAADTYVLGNDQQLFHTVNGSGALLSSGTKPMDDLNTDWDPVDFHAWQPNTNYGQFDIVTSDSMIYYANNAHLSAGLTIEDDISNWDRIDEGYFSPMTEAAALAECRGASGIAYYSSGDVCVTINSDGAGIAPYVSAFAASGNFLNWATASKFDIQKDILTGGKYNSLEQRLIGENRGCAGNRFIKQVPIQQTVPAAANMTLTMSVRMPGAEDRVDWSDDTTRFEVYAITANGIDFQACQDAIEAFQDPGGLGPAEQDVADCVGWDNTPQGPVEHIVYHKAIQECWFYAKHGRWKGGNDHPLKTCPLVYANGLSPLSIDPGNPAYVCYGIYDSGPHDQREGFVGRCWEQTSAPPPPGETCVFKTCACASPTCYYLDGAGQTRRCESDGYEDVCTTSWNDKKPDECPIPTNKYGGWAPVYWDISTPGPNYTEGCTPAAPPAGGYSYWSENLDGIAGDILPEPNADDVAAVCVDQAMHDFCLQTEVPEVIDPSDQATETSDFWNLPAILVDSALFGNLGEHPVATMKGHIEQMTQPQGILHQTATELRIGAMAFNTNGAGTECGALSLPPQIDQYCPRTNQDGARVITPIRLGSLVTEDLNGNGTYDEGDDSRHVDDLVRAINSVRATSWTPLAEAMYNAIGYYTQNPLVRLFNTDFQTDDDVITPWQTNYNYAPGSYIMDGTTLYHAVLGGLSIGGSLATDTGVAWNAVAEFQGNWNNNTNYAAKTIVSSGGKLYITYTGGTSEQKPGGSASPLYDMGVLWEPLIDPVANWCQDNHVLIITEGASTADIHTDVSDFVQGTHPFNITPIEDPGEALPDDPAAQCTDGLQGSTYLDDLTYFAINRTDPTDQFSPAPFDLYPAGNDTIPAGDQPYAPMPKKSITTHIVVAGALRDDSIADECNPVNLMQSAASNSGSDLLRGENPSQLEANLLAFFNDLRQRASAGSAASVISSARGGEGAIYQAIFWPELTREDANQDDWAVAWAGDVHGLFLDNRGFMFEDTNGDRTLLPNEDIDGDGHLDVDEALGEDLDNDSNYDCVNEDVDGDGHLDVDEDVDNDGNLDCGEDLNCNGILDGGEIDVDGDGALDLTEDLNGNGSYDFPPSSPWDEDVNGDGNFDLVYEDVDRDGRLDENEDIDGDGRLDSGEDFNYNGVLDAGEDIDGDGNLDLSEDLDGDGGCSDPWGPDGLSGTPDDNFDAFVDVDGDGHRDVAEDTNGNGVLDVGADRDRRVIIYFDDDLNRSMACYDTSIYTQATCTVPIDMADVHYLWSANDWLADFTLNTATNRTYMSSDKGRYIFTWNDLNNDGIVDNNTEILPLETSVNWGGLGVSGGRGPVVNDFDLTSDDEVDFLISWLRGEDWLTDEDPNGNGVADAGEPGDVDGDGILRHAYRSRQIPDSNGSATNITWRLGDVIHSTPMTVATPAEGYHLIYNDFSYAQFLRKYKRRRHMVYFGANDGMLHAVNAGYFSEKEKKFCLIPLDANGYCPETDPPDQVAVSENVPELGAEMWAYLPYNLQPHVKCLASTGYSHKYFVDQRPRIFDAKIFAEEGACRDAFGDPQFDDPGCIHANGWGTILVGGMRFGGTRIRATELNGGADNREFISSYFILDITNPEEPPELLGELTRNPAAGHVNLGYSSVIPAMVIMKKKGTALTPEVNKWYLAFGSGPRDMYALTGTNKAIKGISDMEARVGILPLDWLTDTTAYPGRRRMSIPDAAPSQFGSPDTGTFHLWSSPNGFISDMVTIDYDINPSYEDYKADALYFGSVQGDFATDLSGAKYWRGGGLMYRLVTKEITAFGSPFGRGVTENVTQPWQWRIKPLIDLSSTPTPNQPITASASIGTDGYNFWIYFGTGRFFDADDKTDHTQHSYYGIKEPIIEVANVRYHTWDQVEINQTGPSNAPGERGLLKVDEILVAESPRITTAALSCRGGGTACLPASVQADPYLDTLERYISGSGDCDVDPDNNCVDGWYKEFYPYDNRERNVGQATLLGGLVTWTTYQPFNDVCRAEGNAYLYGVYYRTGTAWHQNIFGEYGVDNYGNVKDKLDLGRGLATTPNLHAGAGDGDDGDEGPKAFVQTSTGEIVEVEQGNLPIKNYKTGRSKWKEYIKP